MNLAMRAPASHASRDREPGGKCTASAVQKLRPPRGSTFGSPARLARFLLSPVTTHESLITALKGGTVNRPSAHVSHTKQMIARTQGRNVPVHALAHIPASQIAPKVELFPCGLIASRVPIRSRFVLSLQRPRQQHPATSLSALTACLQANSMTLRNGLPSRAGGCGKSGGSRCPQHAEVAHWGGKGGRHVQRIP